MERASPTRLARSRVEIGRRLQALRASRHWSQQDLAKRLDVSQAHLSKVERGLSSLTAEQLLFVLQLFNVPATHFAERADPELELQNAVARLGGSHLHETTDVLPSEYLDNAQRVIREALVTGTPRLVTALAPVLVRQAYRINLPKIHEELARIGLQRRLGWLVDNVLRALEELRQPVHARSREWAKVYRSTEGALRLYLELAAERHVQTPRDVLDATVRSTQTVQEVEDAGSNISRKWGIVTSLQPTDFVQALEAAGPHV